MGPALFGTCLRWGGESDRNQSWDLHCLGLVCVEKGNVIVTNQGTCIVWDLFVLIKGKWSEPDTGPALFGTYLRWERQSDLNQLRDLNCFGLVCIEKGKVTLPIMGPALFGTCLCWERESDRNQLWDLQCLDLFSLGKGKWSQPIMGPALFGTALQPWATSLESFLGLRKNPRASDLNQGDE